MLTGRLRYSVWAPWLFSEDDGATMYSLLLMLSWLPSVPGAPPAPERLRLKSINFKHVLQWERGAGTSPEVTYSVSFHTDRGPCCTVVPGCERLQKLLLCDLTDACSQEDEAYHLRVTALHQSEQSFTSWDDFYPTRDTELQPPVLRMAPCNSSLCVDLDSPVPHLRSTYESFWYELKVECAAQPDKLWRFRGLRRQQVPGVAEGSQSCVSIRFADKIVDRHSNFSQAQCVPVSSPAHTAAVLPPVLLSGLLLLLLAVFYMAITRLLTPALPSMLTSVLHSEEKLEVSCHPAVSSLLLIVPAPPEGQTEPSSAETDSSEDEPDLAEGRGPCDAALYTGKASLCSAWGSTASRDASTAAEVPLEGPEEVDLLTLTFSRDKEMDPSAVAEIEVPLWDVTEEQAELEDEFEEDSFEAAYMRR